MAALSIKAFDIAEAHHADGAVKFCSAPMPAYMLPHAPGIVFPPTAPDAGSRLFPSSRYMRVRSPHSSLDQISILKIFLPLLVRYLHSAVAFPD